MGFLIHSIKDGHIPPWEWKPAKAGTYKIGDAMVISAGQLVPVSAGVGQDTAGGTHYICMSEAIVAADGNLLPVIVATPDITFRAPLAVDSAAIAIGAKYTLHTDGRGITATTAAGAFTVERFDGKLTGNFVYGTLV
jgi:hypothetical protein